MREIPGRLVLSSELPAILGYLPSAPPLDETAAVEYVVTGGGGAEPYPVLFRGGADLYRDSGFPVYHYLTVEVGNHQLHAVMWKVKNPDADTLSVEQKDEFTITALAKP